MSFEYVNIEFLRTDQIKIFRDRLDYFLNCYRNGDKIPPIETMEFDEFDNLLVVNGNHRARAQYEMGVFEIPVIINDSNYKRGNIITRIPDMPIVEGDRIRTEKGIILPRLVW